MVPARSVVTEDGFPLGLEGAGKINEADGINIAGGAKIVKVPKTKTHLCKECDRWFVNNANLKRHYNSELHLNKMVNTAIFMNDDGEPSTYDHISIQEDGDA